MRVLYLAAVALLFACGNDTTPPAIVDAGNEPITSSTSITSPTEWFLLRAGESYTAAENQGLGVTLIGLDLKASCLDSESGCFFPGEATATVDRETATAPQPVYSRVEAQHFGALDEKTIVDFAGAASDPTSQSIVGTFRLRAIEKTQVGVLGAAYPLAATRPIHYSDESLTIRLGAVEFETACMCDDPCATIACVCVLGTNVKVTVLLQTAYAFGLVDVPGNFGGYQVDFDFGNGLDASICYSEVPYKSTVSVVVRKQ